MNLIRRLHLLLGCFFAPLLLFFVVSGAIQIFGLQGDHKDGYKAPEILKVMGNVHTGQRLVQDGTHKSSLPFKGLTIVMSLGFVVTSLLGVVMAFRFFRPQWAIWLLLAAGTLLPLLFLVV